MFYSGMAQTYPPSFPDFSPFDQANSLFCFGGMLDYIGLHSAGKVPEGWQAAQGATMKESFHLRRCKALQIDDAFAAVLGCPF